MGWFVAFCITSHERGDQISSRIPGRLPDVGSILPQVDDLLRRVSSPTYPSNLSRWIRFCYIGFFLAIPLRKKFVLQDPLPFPYAIAAASTINSLHAPAATNQTGARAGVLLLRGLVPAFCWGMLAWCMDGIESLPVFGTSNMTSYTWNLKLSPAPFGQGFIVPPKYILSQALGAIIAYFVFLPLAISHKGDWYPEHATGFEGSDAYTLLPFIFVIAFDSVYQLMRVAVTLFLIPCLSKPHGEPASDAFSAESLLPDAMAKPAEIESNVPMDHLGISTGSWVTGWGISSVVGSVVFRSLFDCSWLMLSVACLR